MSVSVEVQKIDIRINDNTISLTIEEARELIQVLTDTLKSTDNNSHGRGYALTYNWPGMGYTWTYQYPCPCNSSDWSAFQG